GACGTAESPAAEVPDSENTTTRPLTSAIASTTEASTTKAMVLRRCRRWRGSSGGAGGGPWPAVVCRGSGRAAGAVGQLASRLGRYPSDGPSEWWPCPGPRGAPTPDDAPVVPGDSGIRQCPHDSTLGASSAPQFGQVSMAPHPRVLRGPSYEGDGPPPVGSDPRTPPVARTARRPAAGRPHRPRTAVADPPVGSRRRSGPAGRQGGEPGRGEHGEQQADPGVARGHLL